ncbi:hypothetical protein [Rhizobium sullae]|uniref:Auto-transporter adhesin head GIN domain-containing protein n=1 Tax=Rhizobium sullae TaxID=50338 RepID=A0A4R3Q8N9_RHISU|nr:hypothetical protein [Rhizobium sullae]TCU15732.1 hypothetical protein EV132_10672 [Rhizobium sullae]
MSIILSIPLFFMMLVSSFADVRPVGETFDISSIRTIVITGDASSIKITTKSDEPYRTGTSGRRSGWFSSWYSNWFFNICKDESRVELEGATLTIDVMMSAWSDIADCSPEVSANIPPGSAVRIEQQAFMAKLSGDFASLGTSGKAADITLDGHASAVDISGAAVRASLTYDAVKRDEKIEIAAQSLDAYLGFGKDVPVDYTVTAKASYIDSLVPSVPGARPLVNIRGDYVRARIR